MKNLAKVALFVCTICLATDVCLLRAQAATYKEKIDIPGETTWCSSHITTMDGGLMLLMGTYNTATNQPYLTFIKTSASGVIQWNQRFVTTYTNFINVVQSPDSGYFVCYTDAGMIPKYHVLKVDKNGSPVFSNEIQHPVNYSIVSTPRVHAKNNGSFYVVCDLVDTATFKFLWHVFEVDGTGNVTWSHCHNLHSEKSFYADIDTTQNGDVLILGTYYDSLTQIHYIVLSRITATGAPVWTKYYQDGARHFFAHSLVRMPGDYITIAATTMNPVTFENEVTLLKIDGQGNVIWTFLYWDVGLALYVTTIEAVENNCTLICGDNGNQGFTIKSDSSGLMLSRRVYPTNYFCSMDTLSGGLYTFAGYDAFTIQSILMTTDLMGAGCDDTTFYLTKTPLAMQVSSLMSDTIIPLTTSVETFPEAFPTIHSEEICTTIGIGESEQSSFDIYPVPASNTITIESSNIPDLIEIFDISGKQVYSKKPFTVQTEIEVDTWSPGIYLLRMNAGSFTTTRKIIIE